MYACLVQHVPRRGRAGVTTDVDDIRAAVSRTPHLCLVAVPEGERVPIGDEFEAPLREDRGDRRGGQNLVGIADDP